MKRLLPDFHRAQSQHPAGSGNVESLNSALRSLHEPRIIDAKREAAQRLLATLPTAGGKFELTESDAHCWAAAVNDVRLALGTMLEISPSGPDRLPEGHPMAGHLDVYQWLTVLQAGVVDQDLDRPDVRLDGVDAGSDLILVRHVKGTGHRGLELGVLVGRGEWAGRSEISCSLSLTASGSRVRSRALVSGVTNVVNRVISVRMIT